MPAGWHGLWASAPVAILAVGEEGSLHPAVAAGALFFSLPVQQSEERKPTGSACRGDQAVNS
jgi:hypothetical protein